METLRKSVLDILAVDGVDRLGVARKLLLNAPVAGQPLEWLRLAGFVHLTTASGIHLYVVADRVDELMIAAGRWAGASPVVARRTANVVLAAAWFLLWALSDCRPGLLRPLFLVAYRKYAAATGIRPRKWAALAISLGLDATVSLLRALSPAQDFSDVSMGSLHYAAAVGGGILGYEWAREKGWRGWRLHLALAVFSWGLTAPLDLVHGVVSPWTAPLSLISIPLVTGFFYPALLLGVALAAFEWIAGAETVLSWTALALNAGVAWSARWISETGGVRRIEPEWAAFSVFLGLLASFAFRAQSKSLPPSTTKTSPVTQAASSLSKNRMDPATSRGSPTRPSGKAAPRRA